MELTPEIIVAIGGAGGVLSLAAKGAWSTVRAWITARKDEHQVDATEATKRLELEAKERSDERAERREWLAELRALVRAQDQRNALDGEILSELRTAKAERCPFRGVSPEIRLVAGNPTGNPTEEGG